MSFLQKIIDQVSTEVRQKGVKCRGKGEVRIGEHTGSILSAAVRCDGPEANLVALHRREGFLDFSCTCDDFLDSRTPCEHVWATLLTAEVQGHLREWESRGRVEMVAMKERQDDRQDEDEFETASPPAAGSTSRAEVRTIVQSGASKPTVGEASWKKDFNVLREALNSRTVGPTPWPSNRQILYVIDVADTLRGQGLTVELMTQDMKKDGEWGRPRHESLGSDDSQRLPDKADAEIVAILGGAARDSYGFYYSAASRSSRFRVVDAQYGTLIQRLCETGRCPPAHGGRG